MSNVLGTINPMRALADAAHAAGALVAIDAAQLGRRTRRWTSASSASTSSCFSAHKMLGPTGIGVLWARAEILDVDAARSSAAAA